jgi:hypothetical protein
MKQKGAIITLVLVFGFMFLILISGLLGFILLQMRQSQQRVIWNEALQIAEAGVNYYRWRQAHIEEANPGTFWDGKDLNKAICATHPERDPECNIYDFEGIGEFKLEVTLPSACSETVKIKSSGWLSDYPDKSRAILARYGKKSLSQYVFLTDDKVWFKEEEGMTIEVGGKIHSNQGIRMDMANNSLVSSAKDNWLCTPAYGCSPCPSDCEEVWWWWCYCPGVFGSAGGQEEAKYLWSYSDINTIPFDKITLDLNEMKSKAQTPPTGVKGVYLGTISDNPNYYGYHVIFQNDGSFKVKKVTGVGEEEGWGWFWKWFGWGWAWSSEKITAEEDIPIIEDTLQPDCNIIFIEDKIWVDGTVNGRVTLVAADPEEWWWATSYIDIVINGNIQYSQKDGSCVLGLISQDDVWIPLDSPDTLNIDAVVLAQNGQFSRKRYTSGTYSRENLNIYGSVITKISSWQATETWWGGWWWGGWWWKKGDETSGYKNTKIIYDRHLTYHPPPFFSTIGENTIISWEEVE